MISKYTTFLIIAIALTISACSGEKEELQKVACIGDSITYGEGIENREHNSYPAQLEKLLGLNFDVENFGVSGATMLKAGDLSYWNQPELESALVFNPDIVFIMLGSNDSKPWNWDKKGTYMDDYLSLIDQFKKLPSKPEIFVCNPPPAFKVRWGINDSIIRKGIIPSISLIAENKQIKIIDLYTPFVDKGFYFPDCIHPDSAAASQIALTIANTITQN